MIAGLALIAVVTLGLASRSAALRSVPVLGHTFGDGAWAAAAYCGIRLLAPRASVRATALTAIVVAFGVECSQLWRPEWLESLRAEPLVALLIGRGFLWQDLVAYVVGVAVIASLDGLRRRNRT